MIIKGWIETDKMRQIVPYDPNWPVIYNKVKAYIINSSLDVSVRHIGSTSVPGLGSKHMIDLLVIASDPDLQGLKKALIALGFHERDIWVDTEEKPYVGGSLEFDGRAYDINIHICLHGSKTHVQTLRFRNALRRDPVLCRKYEQLKHEAVEYAGTDPKAYNDHKADFIFNVIESQNA